MRATAIAALAAALAAPPAPAQQAVPCGGDWSAFLDGMRAEAVARGVPAEAADAFLADASQSERVLARDRDQGRFQQDFVTFSRRLISQDRIDRAAAMAASAPSAPARGPEPQPEPEEAPFAHVTDTQAFPEGDRARCGRDLGGALGGGLARALGRIRGHAASSIAAVRIRTIECMLNKTSCARPHRRSLP